MSFQNQAIPSTIKFDSYKLRPQDLKTDDPSRAGLYGDITNAINLTYENMLTGKVSDMTLKGVGIYTEPRLPEEDALMKYMMRGLESYTSAYPLEKALGSKVGDYLNGMPAMGPKLEYIDADNGDQFRKFGLLMSYGIDDAGFRTSIRAYNLTQDQVNNGGDGVTILAPTADAADPNVYTTELYLGADQVQAMCESGCNCAPGANECANGYRVVYIIKQSDFDICRTTTREMAFVKGYEYNPLGNGGAKITLQRGIGRDKPEATDVNDPSTFTFTEGMPVDLAAGDILLWGPVVPTTDCLPKVECCAAHPFMQVYCSNSQEFLGCVYCDKPNRRMIEHRGVQNANGNMVLDLPSRVKEAFEIYQVMRNNINQIYQSIMYSTGDAYGSGKPLPVLDDLGAVVESDCEVTPMLMTGILPTIDKWGRKISYFVGEQVDTCGQYNLSRIFEIIGNTMPDNAMLVGDARPLLQYASAMKTQQIGERFLPNTTAEAEKYANMAGSSFDPVSDKIKSMFGDSFSPSGLKMEYICLGGKDLYVMHDSTLALQEPGKLYIIPMDLEGFTFFAPDLEQIHTSHLGFNPYLTSTAQDGQLRPSVYSYDLVPTHLNGQMTYKTKDNCNLCFNWYMRFGIHIEPEALVKMHTFLFGAKIENPAFDPLQPAGPGNEQYIYTSLENAGFTGVCGSAQSEIEQQFNTWYSA